MAWGFIERIWQVGLLKLNVDHVLRLWIVRPDLFEVSLRSLTTMLLVCLVALLHEPIEFKLLEIVALRSLLWMHRWVFNGRENYIVFLLTVR